MIIQDDRPGAPDDAVFWAGNLNEAGWYIHDYESVRMPQSLLANGALSLLVEAMFAASRKWPFQFHFNKGLAGAPADAIGEILIPTEDVVEMRAGKKVNSKRMLYPGYVLIQMEMDENLWHAVKDTPRVTGFVGGGTKPVPLSADEVNAILYRQTSSTERPRPKLSFEKGETVRINDGPFSNFQGKVDDVNSERDTLRVLVTIFGRATPVELDFLQVEKAST